MIDIDKLSLPDKLKLYINGDYKQGLVPQGFYLSKQDCKQLLKALRDQEKLRKLAENMVSIMELGENMRNGDRIE